MQFSIKASPEEGPLGAGPTGSPTPAIVPLKELYLMTIKGYLMTNSSVNNLTFASDPFVLGSMHPFRSLTPTTGQLYLFHSCEGLLSRL